jgi:hypothetical protein
VTAKEVDVSLEGIADDDGVGLASAREAPQLVRKERQLALRVGARVVERDPTGGEALA